MPSSLAARKILTPEVIKSLEQAYQFSIIGIEITCGLNRLQTDRGIFDVAVSERTPAELLFTVLAGQHLEQHGFFELLSISIPNSGDVGVLAEDNLFIVRKACKGHEANLLHAGEREKAMACLAKFHALSAGFSAAGQSVCQPAFPNLRQWMLNSFAELEVFKRCLDEINTEGCTELWEGVRLALKGIAGPHYERVAALEEKRLGVVHGDISSAAFILDEQCWLKLPGNDLLQRGFRIYDLACCLQGVMRQTNWDPVIGHSLLTNYECVNPFAPEERRLLSDWLLFPWSLVESIRKERGAGGKPSEPLIYRFERECKLTAKRIEFAQGMLA